MENSNLSEKINQLLSNPEMLQTVLSLAGNFMQNKSESPESNSEKVEEKKEDLVEAMEIKEIESEAQTPSLNANLDIAEVFNMLKGGSSKGGFSKHNDKRTQLLLALKPYLNNTRSEKIDFIMKILQFTEIAGLMKDFM